MRRTTYVRRTTMYDVRQCITCWSRCRTAWVINNGELINYRDGMEAGVKKRTYHLFLPIISGVKTGRRLLCVFKYMCYIISVHTHSQPCIWMRIYTILYIFLFVPYSFYNMHFYIYFLWYQIFFCNFFYKSLHQFIYT